MTKSCPPTVSIRSSLRDIATWRYTEVSEERSSWKVALIIHVVGLLKKGDADELRDIVPASTPRGGSHRHSGIFRAAVVDGRVLAWRIYAFMVAPESAGG